MAKKQGTHYVDNKKFLEAMKEWKQKCKDAEELGEMMRDFDEMEEDIDFPHWWQGY